MKRLGLILMALAVLAACGGELASPSTQPPRVPDTYGQELFEERVVGASPGCVTCHSLLDGVTIVGPSLHTIVSPVPGMTDAEYVRESILSPDAHITDGFAAGQMNPGWDEILSEEQIDSLVGFLLEG